MSTLPLGASTPEWNDDLEMWLSNHEVKGRLFFNDWLVMTRRRNLILIEATPTDVTTIAVDLDAPSDSTCMVIPDLVFGSDGQSDTPDGFIIEVGNRLGVSNTLQPRRLEYISTRRVA